MPKFNRDVVFGTLMLACAGALTFETFDPQYAGNPLLDYGFPPWFLPRILLGLWGLLSIVVILRGVRAGSDPLASQRWMSVATVVLTVAIYIWAIEQAGFLLATIPFVAACLLALGYRNPVVIVSVTALFPVTVWWTMTRVLQIVLPQSSWFSGF